MKSLLTKLKDALEKAYHTEDESGIETAIEIVENHAVAREIVTDAAISRGVESIWFMHPDIFHPAIDVFQFKLIYAEALRASVAAMEPDFLPAGHVRFPKSADEAVMMCLLGERWLKEHAPERLKGDPDAKS